MNKLSDRGEPTNSGPLVGLVGDDGEVDLVRVLVIPPLGVVLAGSVLNSRNTMILYTSIDQSI